MIKFPCTMCGSRNWPREDTSCPLCAMPEEEESYTSPVIYSVTGYYDDETPDDMFTVFMSGDNSEPAEESGYTDDDIYFYGVTAESLDAAIRDKEALGGFIPVSWELVEEVS